MIDTKDIIVHRGNTSQGDHSSYEQFCKFVAAGFRWIELDIYALSQTEYKFCHPLDSSHTNTIYTIDNDVFLKEVVVAGERSTLIIDFKCLDVPVFPEQILDKLLHVFGRNSIFSAAQPEILEKAHGFGAKTVQYFRDDTESKLSFEPTYYVVKALEESSLPREKTIVYCSSVDQAQEMQQKGFAFVMVDGSLLLDPLSI